MVFNNGLNIPDKETLLKTIEEGRREITAKIVTEIASKSVTGAAAKIVTEAFAETAVKIAAAADFLYIIEIFQLKSGFMKIEHPYKKYGL